MSRFLLTDNGITQTHVEFHHGELIISSSQNVEPILNQNARLKQIAQSSRSPMRLAAQIPIHMHQRWRREWREKYSSDWTWQTFLAMKLNDRSFSKLRTEDMRI